MVELLLRHGAAINILDVKTGRTPLDQVLRPERAPDAENTQASALLRQRLADLLGSHGGKLGGPLDPRTLLQVKARPPHVYRVACDGSLAQRRLLPRLLRAALAAPPHQYAPGVDWTRKVAEAVTLLEPMLPSHAALVKPLLTLMETAADAHQELTGSLRLEDVLRDAAVGSAAWLGEGPARVDWEAVHLSFDPHAKEQPATSMGPLAEVLAAGVLQDWTAAHVRLLRIRCFTPELHLSVCAAVAPHRATFARAAATAAGERATSCWLAEHRLARWAAASSYLQGICCCSWWRSVTRTHPTSARATPRCAPRLSCAWRA
jgi:hypothetical protein